MRTYSMEGLADFIFRLLDKENEEELWQTWLHKEMTLGYSEFKKKYFAKMHKPKNKSLSKEDEKKIIENAMQFIKPINKGGDSE